MSDKIKYFYVSSDKFLGLYAAKNKDIVKRHTEKINKIDYYDLEEIKSSDDAILSKMPIKEKKEVISGAKRHGIVIVVETYG